MHTEGLLSILFVAICRNLFFDELMPSEYDYDDDIAFSPKNGFTNSFSTRAI